MRTQAYLEYLEAVVLCLLHKRGDHDLVQVPDEIQHPSLKGCTLSPINIRQLIQQQRDSRTQGD